MEEKAKYKSSKAGCALRQGEILSNITQYQINIIGERPEDNVEIIPKIHSYAIVVTQDCDLDWDYGARFLQSEAKKEQKLLNSIILCELYTAQEIKDMPDINSNAWNYIKTHRDERYYFFEKVPENFDLKSEGISELTADFKKVFGINAENLYRQIDLDFAQRKTILVSPYLEHFARRYQNFHGRIALPSQYESEK